jgi:hypothetical protein
MERLQMSMPLGYAGMRGSSRELELTRSLRRHNERLRLILAVLANRFEAVRGRELNVSDRLVLAQVRAVLEEVGES